MLRYRDSFDLIIPVHLVPGIIVSQTKSPLLTPEGGFSGIFTYLIF